MIGFTEPTGSSWTAELCDTWPSACSAWGCPSIWQVRKAGFSCLVGAFRRIRGYSCMEGPFKTAYSVDFKC